MNDLTDLEYTAQCAHHLIAAMGCASVPVETFLQAALAQTLDEGDALAAQLGVPRAFSDLPARTVPDKSERE